MPDHVANECVPQELPYPAIWSLSGYLEQDFYWSSLTPIWVPGIPLDGKQFIFLF